MNAMKVAFTPLREVATKNTHENPTRLATSIKVETDTARVYRLLIINPLRYEFHT
jgi:hypothetical protein